MTDEELKIELRDAMLKEYDRVLRQVATSNQIEKFDRAHITIVLRSRSVDPRPHQISL